MTQFLLRNDVTNALQIIEGDTPLDVGPLVSAGTYEVWMLSDPALAFLLIGVPTRVGITESGATAATGSTAPFAAALPAYAIGDLIIVNVSTDGELTECAQMLPSAGPNGEAIVSVRQNHSVVGSGTTVSVFYFVATAPAGAGTLSLYSTADAEWAVEVIQYEGGTVASVNPIDSVSVGGSDIEANSQVTPTWSAVSGNSEVIVFIGSDGNKPGGIGSGWTFPAQHDAGPTVASVAIRDTLTNPAEAVGAVTFTYTTAEQFSSIGYAIAPAGAAIIYPPVNTVAPVVTGTARPGNVLTSSTGTWTGQTPITYTYQWYSDANVITGQTGNTYTVVTADDGRAISCAVTATNTVGQRQVLTASRPVTQAPPVAVGTLAAQSFPAASGVQTYNASGGFTGTALTYSLGTLPPTGVTIDSATGVVSFDTNATGELVDRDITVVATNSGGSASQTFQLDVTTAAAPDLAAAPTISGWNAALNPYTGLAFPDYGAGDMVIVAVAIDSQEITIVTPTVGPGGETIVPIYANMVDGLTAGSPSLGVTLTAFYWIGTGTIAAGVMSISFSAPEQSSVASFKIAAGTYDSAVPIAHVITADGGGLTQTAAATVAITPTKGNSRVVWCIGSDTTPVGTVATGWTREVAHDIGACTINIATRDAPTTAGVAVSAMGMTFTVAAYWAAIGFVINGATTAPPVVTPDALQFDFTVTVTGDKGQTVPIYTPSTSITLYDMRNSTHRANKWRSDGVSPDTATATWTFQIAPSDEYGTYIWGGYNIRDDLEGLSFDASYGSDDSADANTAVGTSSGKTSNGGPFVREGEGSVVFDGLRVHNTHDGIVSGQSGGSDRVLVVKNCYMTHIHDDAIQNDNFHNFVIQDNLIDAAFSWWSTRGGGTGDPTDRSATRMITMRRNIVRLKEFPGFPAGNRIAPGHSKIFKGEANGLDPEIVCIDNIFVVDTLEISPFQWGTDWYGYASGNTMIWMGPGAWPWGALPAGFTLVQGDLTIFNNAKAAWLTAHGWSNATASGNGGAVTTPNTPYTGPFANGIYMLGTAGGSLTQIATDDVLIAGPGADTLTGTSGDVFLYGGSSTGANLLITGQARAFICGGQDSVNTFRLQQTNAKPSYIWNFGSNDILQINGVLTGYSGHPNANFIRFVDAGRDGRLEIRYNGSGSWVLLAIIKGGTGLTAAGLGSRLVVS